MKKAIFISIYFSPSAKLGWPAAACRGKEICVFVPLFFVVHHTKRFSIDVVYSSGDRNAAQSSGFNYLFK